MEVGHGRGARDQRLKIDAKFSREIAPEPEDDTHELAGCMVQ